MASPTVDASATTNGTSGGNDTVNLPAGISSGDLLLGYFALSNNTAGPYNISWPAGWTEIKDLTQGPNISVAYRDADGTEGSTITMTNDNVQRLSSVICRISGHDSGTAPEVSTGVQSASFADIDPDSITPTGGSKDYLFCCFGATQRDSTVITAVSTSYTVVGSIQTTGGAANGHNSAMGSRALTAASDDPGTYTQDANRNYVACTVAVHPAAGGDTAIAADAIATGVTVLSRDHLMTKSAAATGVAELSSALFKTLSATTIGVANVVADFIKAATLISANAVATGVVTLQRSLFRTLSASGTGTATIQRTLFKTFSGVATGIADAVVNAITALTKISIDATASGVVEIQRLVFKTFPATATGVAASVETFIRAAVLIAVDAVATGVVTIQRSMLMTKAGVSTGVTDLSRIIFKSSRLVLGVLSPDVLLDQTNLSGSIGDIQDDPDDPDANWLTAIVPTTGTVCHVSFATPVAPPKAGANLQEYQIWARKSASGGTDPTISIQLYENNSLVRVLLSTSMSSLTGTLFSTNWNANEIATADGSLVECRIQGFPATTSTVEVGAVEWNAQLLGEPTLGTVASGVASIQRTVFKTLSGTATGIADAVASALAGVTQISVDAVALGVAAIQRTHLLTKIIAATGVSAIQRIHLMTKSVISTGVAEMQRTVLKTLHATATGIVNVVVNTIAAAILVSVDAVATGVVTLQRTMFKTLSISAVGIGDIQRLIFKTLKAIATGVAVNVSVKFKQIVAAAVATGVVNAVARFIKFISPAVPFTGHGGMGTDRSAKWTRRVGSWRRRR